MRLYFIEQEEVRVVPARQSMLVTEGVSTCICILMRGHIDAKPFLAMYHWDGLPFGFTVTPEAIGAVLQSVVTRIESAIRLQMKKLDMTAQLDYCHCVGGERRTADLSGTELEVQMLQEHLERVCAKYFIVKPTTEYIHSNFLTEGNVSLRVMLTATEVRWQDDRLAYVESEEDLCSPGRGSSSKLT